MNEIKRIAPVTYTCKEAVRRHRGTNHITLIRMCNRGEYLALKYGGRDKIPLKELRTKPCLFAHKVGRLWQIPIEELNRVFLGR